MSKIMNDLRKLIVPRNDIRQGTVTGVNGDVVSISSPNGPRNFKVPNPGSYVAGNKVRYQGELFIGKVTEESSLPHYSV
jgi:hypothetical protein